MFLKHHREYQDGMLYQLQNPTCMCCDLGRTTLGGIGDATARKSVGLRSYREANQDLEISSADSYHCCDSTSSAESLMMLILLVHLELC